MIFQGFMPTLAAMFGKHPILAIGLLLTSMAGVFAQNWGIEASSHFGKVVKHSPYMEFSTRGVWATGWECHAKYHTYGKKNWEQHQGYPQMGVGLVYFNYGDKELLGQSISILPHLTIDFIRREGYFVQMQFGTGLAWLSRRYHPQDNPHNTAISSHWNNITAFRFDAGIPLGVRWQAQAGIGLTHFSNGASRLPNLGLNIVAGTLGLKYTPHPHLGEPIRHPPSSKKVQKRWGGQLHFDMGYRDYDEADGPSHPTYIGSVALSYQTNTVNRILLGYEMEYAAGVRRLLLDHFGYSEKAAQQEARRQMFFVADELLFGDFSILLLTGIYTQRKFEADEWIYNKLALRYYLPPVGRPATRFYAAVYLKSHLSTAEYIALGIGAAL